MYTKYNVVNRMELFMLVNGLNITRLQVGSIRTNCYLVSIEDSKKAFVIDPGDNAELILECIEERELEIEAILLTHGHFDHIMALDDIRRVLRCPCIAYVDEESLLEDSQLNCSTMTGQQLQIKADRFVKDGEVISLADIDITVLHTHGHTKGSCWYYLKDYKTVFRGETLFLESLGRTDLPR